MSTKIFVVSKNDRACCGDRDEGRANTTARNREKG